MDERTHLDRIKEQHSFEELLSTNDLTEDDVLKILYDLGYLLYPKDRTLYPKEIINDNG